MMKFGHKILGKSTVLCKDTPAFIANRVGVYAIQELFHVVNELNLTVSEVDLFTGPIMGRPKSATFRTCDVVGLDTLIHVANGLKNNCPEDEKSHVFDLPDFIKKMQENNWLGSKTGQGFYKKTVDENGKKSILELDLKTFEYKKPEKQKYETIGKAKNTDNLSKRMSILFNGKDKAGEFYRKIFSGLFSYAACRIPEISDEVYRLDQAMKAGFGWEMGPFELWDAVGFENGIKAITDAGLKIPVWLNSMQKNNVTSFYNIVSGQNNFYDIGTSKYQNIPGTEKIISLANLDSSAKVYENDEASIVELGDGIINVEFHSKMNTVGGGILSALNEAIDMAEKGLYKGIVISNEGANFSAGANVAMIFMMAAEQDYDELNLADKAFQNTTMRLRYSSIPVVAAPHGMTLGGGCEICMHADKVIAHAETYMGLVEFGVGLIPGGGGTKEMALRFSDEIKNGDLRTNRFRDKFLTIGQAKVSTSGHEAIELGYLRKGVDEVIISRADQISYAKKPVFKWQTKVIPTKQKKKHFGISQEGLGIVYAGANAMRSGNYMSDHDQLISEKLEMYFVEEICLKLQKFPKTTY